MRFRPTFWPTLVTLPALIVLLALGWWQLERLEWKTALIQELELRSGGEPIPLPDDPRIPPHDLLFRNVTVTGHYVHEAEMRLLNRVRDGEPGINLITPLEREDGAGIIFVNRGWVPFEWRGTPLRAAATEPRKVRVTGIVRTADLPGWLTPENRPERNDWYYVDLDAMANAVGMLANAEYYVFATDEEFVSGEPRTKRPPHPNEWRIDLPNNHLSYAITWFSLAAALLAIYLLYHKRPHELEDS